MSAIQRVKENADVTKRVIYELKSELDAVNKEYNQILTKQLIEENVKLTTAVEEAKKKLIQMEIINGLTQINVPSCKMSSQSTEAETGLTEPEKLELNKPKKEIKPKKEKNTKEKNETPTDKPVDIGRLDLRIGKVEEVQRHPDADALYLLKINCGEEKPRTVCSGLVKYVPINELKDRMVLVLCNLKPVKMRGVTSEAMVMCASSESGVEVLSPPKDSQQGELVECDGYVRQPDPVMNPKKKIFESVAPDLHTNDKLEACYKNVPLVITGKGPCVAKSLRNVPVK